MTWGISLFYMAIALGVAWLNHNEDERWYAFALLVNAGVCNVGTLAAPYESGAAFALVCETGLFSVAIASAIVLYDRATMFLALAIISLPSIALSINQAIGTPLAGYEAAVNALFLVECFVISRRRLGNVWVGLESSARHWLRDAGMLGRNSGVSALPMHRSERPDDSKAG